MSHLPTTAVALCAIFGFAGPAFAQQNPVVVELYTSQGCAACPPADYLLNQIAEHESVLPLALHVDYWDYIGWADTFGQSAFSERQKSYARKMGRKSVYTPQMVIGGLDDVQGNATMQVMDRIAAHRMSPFAEGLVTVELVARSEGGLDISLQARDLLEYAADVQLVHFLEEATVEIAAGENAGRDITYRNIVTDWQVIGAWDGRAPFGYTVSQDLPEGVGVAVIVQEQGLGPIIAAARYP